MQDDQLEDLKQYIGATVSQTEERLREEIHAAVSGSESRLEQKINALDKKMEDGFAGVAEAIEEIHTELVERDKVVDRRLTKLEQRVA